MADLELDIPAVRRAEISWKELLAREGFLQLPAAHDALTAKLIERAGFPAYQVGGFALVGARYGRPDVDLEHFGEKNRGVQDVIDGCALPVLIDGDDGYGDVKNVTRTVRGYEALGAAAIFLEDQTSPKRCGHMAGKTVVPVEQMVAKVRAAVAARQKPDTFFLARTDAIEPEGVDSAIARARAKVGDVMSPEVKYCFIDDDTDSVLDKLAEMQVRRLPVLDHDKRLVGIVSIGDLAGNGETVHAGEALGEIARPSSQHSQMA